MADGYSEAGQGLDAVSSKLTWLVDDLRRTAEQLQQAVASADGSRYEAASPDGLVRVAVNGRCRVTSLELSPYVLREDPDTLDTVLTATLNDALRQALAGRQEALAEQLPPGMLRRIEQTVDDARREVDR